MLEREAVKEVERAKEIMENIEVIDSKRAESLLKVMKSYYEDCLSFYKNEKWLQALETAYIVWAYADSGLHLGVFRVPDSMKRVFTV